MDRRRVVEKLSKVVQFKNDLGKNITFWLSHEQNLFDEKDFEKLNYESFKIGDGESLDFEDRYLTTEIYKLLEAFNQNDN